MAARSITRTRTTHYHAQQATVEWQKFVAAMAAVAHASAAARLAEDNARKRDTTYAAGVSDGD